MEKKPQANEVGYAILCRMVVSVKSVNGKEVQGISDAATERILSFARSRSGCGSLIGISYLHPPCL